MTDHDEAVQIAISVPVYPQTTDEDHARAIVAALARAGLLARPGELAALWAQVEELEILACRCEDMAGRCWVHHPDGCAGCDGDAAGLLARSGELAALHEKLRGALDSVGRLTEERDAARAEIERLRAIAALDAAPAAETTSGVRQHPHPQVEHVPHAGPSGATCWGITGCAGYPAETASGEQPAG